MSKTSPEKQKEYNDKFYKSHYRQNVQYYLDRNKRRLEKIRKLIQFHKKNKSCFDCGVQYPPFVMDFDHRKGEQKVYEIAQMPRRGLSEKRIIEEIGKCDLICANCHRLRTFKYTPQSSN